jgi:ABC-type branched-subunit amino acid transport system substrate-binding protein
VVAAIGHFREGTTGAASSVYAETGIPLVAPAVFAPTLTGSAACDSRPSSRLMGMAGWKRC